MNELTLIIDSWGHKELKDYLMSLEGINDVEISDIDKLNIYLKYNSKLITPKIIKMEIFLFLDIAKFPSIYAFDKHSHSETKKYMITRADVCCEYCFRGAIEDLFDIDGIEKVASNFDEYNYPKDSNISDKIQIQIDYDPNKINLEKMMKIEEDLNL